MSGKLIIEGNAVYELDEECMLRKDWIRQMKKKSEKQKAGWSVKYPKEDTKK